MVMIDAQEAFLVEKKSLAKWEKEMKGEAMAEGTTDGPWKS